jgi:plasmid segregation protein ParM
MRDKTADDRFYVLTLFAIACEIEQKGDYAPGLIPIKLLVGLPPAHYGMQFERFERYFKRNTVEEYEFHEKRFRIYINEATAYPQAFAAAMPVYGSISALPKVMVIDIGGFTADYLLLRNGQADLSVCDSLEHGVIILYNQITARLNSELDLLLDESDIDNILRGESNDHDIGVKRIVNDTAQMFVADLFGKLRERAIDLRSGKTIFVGGGSMLVRKQIEDSGKVSSPMFVEQISANASGYELLYKASKTGR